MARALIVGCGCRGLALAERLAAEGWRVRGTTRDPGRAAVIEAAGVEAAIADPDQPASLLDLVGDVTVVQWLMGSASGDPETVAAIHDVRLQALLEKLVDTPVRGFVYEAAGEAPREQLDGGAEIARAAAETWRLPVEVVAADPDRRQEWLEAMTAATGRLVGN